MNILQYIREYSIEEQEKIIRDNLLPQKFHDSIDITEFENKYFYEPFYFGRNVDTVWYRYVVSRNLDSSFTEFGEFDLL